MEKLEQLRRAARDIFQSALAQMDAGEAVRRAVRLEGDRLSIFETNFDLRARPAEVYCVALGKAAGAMASALEEILGDRLAGGVVSAPRLSSRALTKRWRVFEGGHPEPNEASLSAARAAFDLLRRADEARGLVLFLVSGGGSAMLEWPRDEKTTLAELREANRALVTCGASISEINSVRRAVSAVKGGGLAAHAPRAAQVTLIISDTNSGQEANVASGPTLPPPADAPDASTVVARYNLDARLPPSVLRAIKLQDAHDSTTTQTPALPPIHPSPSKNDAPSVAQDAPDSTTGQQNNPMRQHYTLLDNERAIERAADAARERGFEVEVASDLIEQEVSEGSAVLVSRLVELHRRRASKNRAVCLISGGEFACLVRGRGVGGRNTETVLRCAIEMDERRAQTEDEASIMVALSAGTDGIDGNSPAAGALADHTTIPRALNSNLDPHRFLRESDAYTFFQALGDTIITGPTGTNVRDLRILIEG
ncbi:MAG TPA: DUF4147 domain-containing protein [Pyrinomonadaceae bacterium]|jgi:hydroxypyruvate reductase